MTRLSENPSVVVGVIEAGEYDPNVPEINIPGRWREGLTLSSSR